MGSTDVIARDQVLAELATLSTGTNDAVSLLSQTHDLARFADQVQGELARLAGIVDASGAYAEVGYTSAAAFLRYGCGRSAVRGPRPKPPPATARHRGRPMGPARQPAPRATASPAPGYRRAWTRASCAA